MAQLKDTLVQGSLRVTDNIYSDTIYLKSIFAPTTSDGNTLSAGTNGYTLKTNGSSVYWAADNNANYYHTTGSWSGLTYTATANGGAGELKFTIPSASTSAAGAVQLSSTASSSEQGKAATPKLVYDSIAALNVSNISGFGAGKTLASLSEAGGKISATFQDINITKSQISDFPSTMPPSAHNHYQLVTEGDNRGVATTPNNYNNTLIFRGLKTNSSFGSPSSDSYSYVIGLRGWSDSSGGDSHELAFNNTGIFWRQGATTSWGNWYRIYTTGNKPSKSDVGLGNVTNHAQVTAVIWDNTNKKLQQSISGGTATDIVTPYWANLKLNNAASYNTTPEVATVKINGNTSASAASTSNVTLVYNTTTKALDFNFA